MAEQKIFGLTINTDAITNLPDTYKYIAGGVLSALILFGGGYYFSYPVYTEYQTLLEANDILEQDNKAKETKLGFVEPNKYREIDKMIDEKKLLEQEIEKLKTRIPSREEIPSLIFDFEKLIEEDHKSDLLSFSPTAMTSVSLPPELQSTKPTGLDLKQIPLTLSIESNYPTMINLFKDIERYQRAMSTASVTFTPINDRGNKYNALAVNLNLKAFVLPEGGN